MLAPDSVREVHDMRVLVVNGGRQYQWGQIALAFHRSGHQVTFAAYSENVLSGFAGQDIFFDAIVTQKLVVVDIFNDIARNVDCFRRQPPARIVIFQYDDLFFELAFYFKVAQALERSGLPFTLTLWLNCVQSLVFLRANYRNVSHFFSWPPVYPGLGVFLPAGPSGFGQPPGGCHTSAIDDITCDLFALYDRLMPDRMERFDGKAVYFGRTSNDYYPADYFGVDSNAEINKYRHVIYALSSKEQPATIFQMVEAVVGAGLYAFGQQHAAELLICSHVMAFIRQKRIRPPTMKALQEHFGEALIVYGGGWADFGISSIVDSLEPMPVYASAAFSIDIGSQYLDTCLYQRPVEILASGGRIIQSLQPDTFRVFTKTGDRFTFDPFRPDVARLTAAPRDRAGLDNDIFQDALNTIDDPAACVAHVVALVEA
jgi:hypothetical protein